MRCRQLQLAAHSVLVDAAQCTRLVLLVCGILYVHRIKSSTLLLCLLPLAHSQLSWLAAGLTLRYNFVEPYMSPSCYAISAASSTTVDSTFPCLG